MISSEIISQHLTDRLWAFAEGKIVAKPAFLRDFVGTSILRTAAVLNGGFHLPKPTNTVAALSSLNRVFPNLVEINVGGMYLGGMLSESDHAQIKLQYSPEEIFSEILKVSFEKGGYPFVIQSYVALLVLRFAICESLISNFAAISPKADFFAAFEDLLSFLFDFTEPKVYRRRSGIEFDKDPEGWLSQQFTLDYKRGGPFALDLDANSFEAVNFQRKIPYLLAVMRTEPSKIKNHARHVKLIEQVQKELDILFNKLDLLFVKLTQFASEDKLLKGKTDNNRRYRVSSLLRLLIGFKAHFHAIDREQAISYLQDPYFCLASLTALVNSASGNPMLGFSTEKPLADELDLNF